MNKPITLQESNNKLCLLGIDRNCSNCTGWIEVNEEITRDNSRNKYNTIMTDLGLTRNNQIPISEGSNLILESQGLCYRVIEANHLVKSEE